MFPRGESSVRRGLLLLEAIRCRNTSHVILVPYAEKIILGPGPRPRVYATLTFALSRLEIPSTTALKGFFDLTDCEMLPWFAPRILAASVWLEYSPTASPLAASDTRTRWRLLRAWSCLPAS